MSEKDPIHAGEASGQVVHVVAGIYVVAVEGGPILVRRDGIRRRVKCISSVPPASQSGMTYGVSWPAAPPRPLRSMPSGSTFDQSRHGSKPTRKTEYAIAALSMSNGASGAGQRAWKSASRSIT